MHMISNEVIELLKLQTESLALARKMKERWPFADENQRATLLADYIESRRKLPRLENGKHLGHSEAHNEGR